MAGKDGNEYSLSYGENFVIGSVLTLLLNKKIDFSNATNAECKEWAAALKKNLDRVRILHPAKSADTFGMIEGMDPKRLFSTGPYSDWSHSNAAPQLEGAAVEPLSESWRESITEFADFLESCGGLTPLSENAYKYPEA